MSDRGSVAPEENADFCHAEPAHAPSRAGGSLEL
jgi:hypothetical protein